MDLVKNNMNYLQIHINGLSVHMDLGINDMNPEQTGMNPVSMDMI